MYVSKSFICPDVSWSLGFTIFKYHLLCVKYRSFSNVHLRCRFSSFLICKRKTKSKIFYRLLDVCIRVVVWCHPSDYILFTSPLVSVIRREVLRIHLCSVFIPSSFSYNSLIQGIYVLWSGSVWTWGSRMIYVWTCIHVYSLSS